MNILNLKISEISPSLNIGFGGENGVTAIAVDFTEWVEEFGVGTLELIVRRSMDSEQYLAPLTTENNIAVLIVSDVETSYKGHGEMQYVYTVGETVKKSPVFGFNVNRSLESEVIDTPDAFQTWFDQIIEKASEMDADAQRVAEAVSHYPKIENDYWYVWNVSTEEWEDTGVYAKGLKGDKGDTGNGIENVTMTTDYELVITFTDGTVYKTSSVRGEKGYSPSITFAPITNGTRVTVHNEEGDSYFDILDGEKGDAGKGISSISKTGTSGLVDTYTITYTDGTTSTFTVTNGAKGETGATPNITATAETGLPGTEASVTVTGTAENPVMHFTIPRGNPGEVTQAELDALETDLKEDLNQISGDVETLTQRVDTLEELDGVHRYGVTGILNASPVLTRIYDSVGLTAAVGTDTETAVNDFDSRTPFNRRKCVGTWNLINGKPVFEVNAYLGDDDYTEDGTMGDYVAVECPRAFYKMDGQELVVSAYQYPGYRPFDIFCRNHDPEDTMPFYYLPAYALALNEGGNAVCLPGYDNCQGDYKSLFDKARTYKDGALGNFSILQPTAVNFYEWVLFTVEFATLNCQSIMQGCAGLRHNANDRITFVDATHILMHEYYASRVVGEYIAIIPTNVDINHSGYLATHRIVSIIRSDAEGNPSASGTYQYCEVEDLGKTYWTYDYTGATEYRNAARPYRTGDCNSVLTPSGSPVSNRDSYHPMRYRYRENVYSNQFKTTVDLFNMRVGTDDTDWMLEWYYITNPANITNPKNYGTADLETDLFAKLGVETNHEHYANGIIRSKLYDAEFPDIWIPHQVTGASYSTYFCDYAFLVSSYVVRSVRFGGYWYSGSLDGFSYVYAYSSPASAIALYGGDLFVTQ